MKCPKCGRELLSTGMCSNLMCDYRRDREGLISEKEKDIIEEKKVVAKKQKNEIKPDAVLKEYWRNNDTESSQIVQEKELLSTLSRSRDVVKRYQNGIDLVLVGIEDQMKIHYAMPVRCMLYDALGYTRQCKQIEESHKKKKELKGSEAFLSGIKKEDKIHLIITLVIYYGEEKWDGATTLTDLLKIPEEWKEFVNDYKMFLIEMRNENKWEFQNKDNDIFFAIVKEALGKKKLDLKEFKKRYEDRKVDKETLAAISVLLGKQTLLEYAQKSEKGEMSMCTALDNLEKEAREEGVIIGVIEAFLSLGMDEENIKKNVMEKYHLIEEDYENYLKEAKKRL